MCIGVCLRWAAAMASAGMLAVLALAAAPMNAAAAPAATSHSQPVNHSNIGAAHSPRLLRQLAGPRRRTAPDGALPGAVQGIDIASYQHPHGAAIDWARVAAGRIQFAAVKVTEGTYYRNPHALGDLAGAKAAGISVFAYAFAIPNGNGGSRSAAAQADYLLSSLGASGRATPIMLDIEYNPYGAECYRLGQAAMVSWVTQFDAAVHARTGRLPVIYTPPQWWHRCTGGSAAFGQTPLWVPDYGTGSSPARPAGWSRWAFWQYSSSGTVQGIDSPKGVDLDQLGPGQLPLLDPGNQRTTVGSSVGLPVALADQGAGHSPAFTATGLPRGLSITVRGRVAGRPARTGTYRVTVRAADSGRTGSVAFAWTVRRRS